MSIRAIVAGLLLRIGMNWPCVGGRAVRRGLFIALSLSMPTLSSAEPTWQVFQLTDGAELDFVPDLSGTTYVWQRKVGNGAKIMMWSEGETSPSQISMTTKDFRPRMSDKRVVWESTDGSGGDDEVQL